MSAIRGFGIVVLLSLLAAGAGCAADADPPTRRPPPLSRVPISQPPIRPTEPTPPPIAAIPTYPLHKSITATVFWIGEPAAGGSPSNVQSAWDDRWMQHYGGVDEPRRREGFRPGGFVPGENPFYIALPYNDLPGGKRRADAASAIPWAAERAWAKRESMCKNRWVKISKGEKTCYAQWEDVGPFVTDDAAYVFGSDRPRNKGNRGAGIDVSPAVRDYLGLSGMDTVDWQFVDARDVPEGLWRKIVTTSQVDW